MSSAPRVLIVSNRLPVTVTRAEGELRVSRSTGGLATGVSSLRDVRESLWLGWSGLSDELPPDEARQLDERLSAMNLVPVPLSADEVERYYEGFCNGLLWPLFHYLIGQIPLEIQDLGLYETINARFAEAVVQHYRPGDLIWVHDYQLMLVPEMVRERLPDARIGFFLHIPFPASDVFRALPFRDRLLRGLLGADLVGFHTVEYMRNFASSVLRTLGMTTEADRVRVGYRTVHLGVFPMGVDAQGISTLASSPEVDAQVRELRGERPEQLLVGIDRLDYTKGIQRRLMAFERLLRERPDLREKVRLVQVAVPSRTNVEAYQELRTSVDTLIGRIHGEFATPNWVPIHYMFRGLPESEVVALYRAADALLVTPVRDGMNLVAKEFIASRNDEGGVLVLSEFAGAACELAEAVQVNPFDVAHMADSYDRALRMGRQERRTRMRALRRRVFSYDVHHWAHAFLERLAAEDGRLTGPRSLSRPALAKLAARMRGASQLVLLLDYDGTLVPIADTPELAYPDWEALDLLSQLAARPHTEVHVISGRDAETLERWLGHLPLHLHGEHGLWSRPPGQPGHANLDLQAAPWKDGVRALFQDYAERTPGALVEEKLGGLAWHYRKADPEFGPMQAHELRLQLGELIKNASAAILSGSAVVEVRALGVNKGLVVPAVLAANAGALIVAIGDDTTDEELFSALPPESIRVRVGPGESRAEVRLEGVAQVRELLRLVLG